MSKEPVISAFNWVPGFARGRVRDLRIRWALEEIGQPYDTHLFNAAKPRDEDYLRWQPFGQVPAFRDDEVAIFESGAILLRLAEHEERLLPAEPAPRWQAIAWLFAALNSIEGDLAAPTLFTLFYAEQPWSAPAAQAMVPAASKKLQQLSQALGDKEWLAGQFSIADIAMATVLLTDSQNLIEEQPSLVAYRDRAQARPAYRRALDAQLADFKAKPEANPHPPSTKEPEPCTSKVS